MRNLTKILLLACIVILSCMVMFTSCDDSAKTNLPNDTTNDTTDDALASNGTATDADSHVHTFGDWTTVKEATCIEKGEQKRTCACGEKQTQSIDMVAHNEVTDQAIAPTCITSGATEGKHCSVCNTVLVRQEIIKATGHVEVIDEGTAPSCTTAGLSEGKHCSVCNDILVKQTTIDALGHTEVIDEGTAPSCTTAGLSEGKHCSMCETIIVAQEELVAQHNDEHGVCLTCNEVTNGDLAAQYYVKVDPSIAYGKICTCYYNGSVDVCYYVEGITYSVDVCNTYDGGIAIDVCFDIDYDIIDCGPYYEDTAFLNYVIMDNNYTIESGYMTVEWGRGHISCAIFLDEISSHFIYLNIGDYYM